MTILIIFSCRQERQRVALHPPRPSRFKGEPLPDRVSIDYFTPSFWNHDLSVEDKAHYIKDGVFIGMPPAYLCSSWKDVLTWKGLSRKQMTEKYGRAVLKDYVIPSEEELQQLKDNQERREEEKRAAHERHEEVEVEVELGQPAGN
jgi:hypothetical protein